MKNSQAAALLGVAIGALLIYLAYNSGERVIVGAMENGRPIIGHVLNKPMLAAGIGLAAASVLVFGMGFRPSSAGPRGTDAARKSESPGAGAVDGDSPPSESGTSDAPAGDRPGA